MSTVAARSFKENYPDSHLTLGVNKRYKDILPLFHDSEHFDSTHLYSTYDGWPGPKDREYLAAAKYDLVFNAMPPHRDSQWWLHRHQYQEVCHALGLPIPTDWQPRLKRWFSLNSSFHNRVVALAPFGGSGGVNDKALSVKQAQAIVDWLTDHAWTVIHLGGPNEPQLDGAKWLNTNYFDSVRNMLSCRALIHCDTGLGHVAGAYNFPSLGLYCHHYFGKEWVHQIMPTHSNFLSLSSEKISDLELDSVFKSINLLLS